MKKTWAVFAVLIGLGVIVVTVWLIIKGVKHPTARLSIGIAVLSAIGVPVALAVISVGYRQFRGPNSETLKTEAEAKRRAAAALEDAETAEQIRAELNAYVAIRSGVLKLNDAGKSLLMRPRRCCGCAIEPNDMETQLGVDMTRVSRNHDGDFWTSAFEAGPPIQRSLLFYVYGIPVGEAASMCWSIRFMITSNSARLRHLASLAPEALQAADRGQVDGREAALPDPR